MDSRRLLLPLLLSVSILSACQKESGTGWASQEEASRFYVNTFAYNVMRSWYLWNEEISDYLGKWEYNSDPIPTVKSCRYKVGTKEIDRWTTLTDDFSTMVKGFNSVLRTFGFEFILVRLDTDQGKVGAVVTLVYPGGAAEKAGMRRGQIITHVNGKELNLNNCTHIAKTEMMNCDACTLGLYRGQSISLASAEMYENPVVTYKIFRHNGKSVGYLFYNRFSTKSIPDLVQVCKYFKEKGIHELILDLRYNSGGAVLVEQVMASMLAPPRYVNIRSLYEMDLYNSDMAKNTKDKSYFTTKFSYVEDGTSMDISTDDANVDIDHLYVITSSNTASASESLIIGLKAYMPVTVIGQRTHGKYCTGLAISAASWYDSCRDQFRENQLSEAYRYTDNWGIYVMISRFADKNGETACMPDGLAPDFSVTDTPEDGVGLGDENEVMLHSALVLADILPNEPATKTSSPEFTHYEQLEYEPLKDCVRLYGATELLR